jgi:hypothetical protein
MLWTVLSRVSVIEHQKIRTGSLDRLQDLFDCLAEFKIGGVEQCLLFAGVQ